MRSRSRRNLGRFAGDRDAARVYRTIRGMPFYHPVRRCAEAIFSGDPFPHGFLDDVNGVLAARRTRIRHRAAAVWVLDHGPLTESERAAAAESITEMMSGRDGLKHLTVLVLAAVVYQPLLIALVIMDRHRCRLRVGAIRALQHFQYKRSISCILAEAFNGRGPMRRSTRDAAVAALPDLLGLLTLDDYGSLSPTDVQNLCKLAGNRDEEVAVAALDALAAAGTGAAVGPLSDMTKDASKSSSAIREKVADVLVILTSRLRSEMAAAALLRAVDSPDSNDATLLRAAGNTAAEPESLLLRGAAEPHSAQIASDESHSNPRHVHIRIDR